MNTVTSHIVNGINVADLGKTVEVIGEQPEIANFKFRATNQLIEGGLNRSEVKEFHGAMQEHRTDKEAFVLMNDEPMVLLSQDQAPNPVEYVIQALLGCMTTTTNYKAAAEGIEIQGIRSEIEGDIDLHGIFGLDPDVRPGFQEMRAKLYIKTTGTKERVAELFKSSPVFDTLSRPVPVKVEVIFEN